MRLADLSAPQRRAHDRLERKYGEVRIARGVPAGVLDVVLTGVIDDLEMEQVRVTFEGVEHPTAFQPPFGFRMQDGESPDDIRALMREGAR